MTGEMKILENLKRCIPHDVELPDGRLISGNISGSLPVRRSQSGFIHDVVFVPGLSKTLLSVAKLTQAGYKCDFGELYCTVYGAPLLKGKMINGVYLTTTD